MFFFWLKSKCLEIKILGDLAREEKTKKKRKKKKNFHASDRFTVFRFLFPFLDNPEAGETLLNKLISHINKI